jgi:glycosyltransferase domain-containing protein
MLSKFFTKYKNTKVQVETNSSLKSLSFIILSKNRRELLKNKVDVLQKTYSVSNDQILIGEDNTRSLTKLTKYHLIEPGSSPLNRLNKLMKTVTTEYSIITADDDIIISKNLSKYLIFLDLEKDYVACQGLFYSKFEPYSQNESYRPSLMAEGAEERILSLIDNYGHLNYSIVRTSVLKKMCFTFQTLKSHNSYNFQELLWNIILTAHGKIHVIEEPFVLREPSPTRGWWRDFVEGNLMQHLASDVDIGSKAILDTAKEFNQEVLLQIILYFIFRDSTCLSSKTKALIKKFKNQKNEKKDLKTNLKSIRTKNFIITNK